MSTKGVGLTRPRPVWGSWGAGLGRLLFLFPLFAVLAVSLGWPVLEVLLRSLNSDGAAELFSKNTTLEHYSEVFSDGTLRQVLTNTVAIAVWATALTTLLAFPVAYLLTRLSRRVAIVVLTLVMVPFWVSILVRLFAFTAILGKRGVVNSLAGDLGLGGPYELLFNRPAAVIGMVAYLLPYLILVLYAGMSGIDTTLMTAAKTLGARGRQAFFRIYFPLIRGTLLSGMMLVFVLSLGFFLTPAILGGPRDTTVPVYIQSQITNFQWGTASATGIILLVVTLVGFMVVVRGIGMSGVTGTAQGSAGKGTVAQDPLRFSVLSVVLWVVTGIVMVGMLAPLLVVIPSSFGTSDLLTWPPQGFTTKWYTEVLTEPVWTEAFGKSALVALGTAVVSTALGLHLARVVSRVRSANGRFLIHTLIYSPIVVPVILLAVGIYGVQARLGLLGTNVGLILAHTVIALPLAFIVISSALGNLDPGLESAAWTLGASKTQTFWRVVLPNIVPSLVGALLITFITSWDEVVIAIFQTGLEKTLPVTIFGFLKSGITPAVAAAATLLVGAVALVVVIYGVMSGRRTARRA